jgi:hypothetical protein
MKRRTFFLALFAVPLAMHISVSSPAEAKRARKSTGKRTSRSSKRRYDFLGSSNSSGYYSSCSEARAAGAAPLREGQKGYSRRLDRDGDGIACE